MHRRDGTATVLISVPHRNDLDLKIELDLPDDDADPLTIGDLIAAAEEVATDRGYIDVETLSAADGEIELTATGWAHPRPDEPETIELELTRRKLGWLLEAIETTTTLEDAPAAPALAEAWAQVNAAIREIDDDARAGR